MEWIFLTLLRPFAKGVLRALSSYAKRENKVPSWAFLSMSHVVPYTSFELLIIRDGEYGPEIFLTQRPPQDPEWPNAWHFPGTIMRIADSFEIIKDRLAKDELTLSRLPGETSFVTMLFDEDVPRGNTLHTYHRLDVDSTFENKNGNFFPLSHLPEGMLHFQHRQLLEINDLLLRSR